MQHQSFARNRLSKPGWRSPACGTRGAAKLWVPDPRWLPRRGQRAQPAPCKAAGPAKAKDRTQLSCKSRRPRSRMASAPGPARLWLAGVVLELVHLGPQAAAPTRGLPAAAAKLRQPASGLRRMPITAKRACILSSSPALRLRWHLWKCFASPILKRCKILPHP